MSLKATIVPTRNESEQMAVEFSSQQSPTAKWSAPENEYLQSYQLLFKTLKGIQENYVTTSLQEAKINNEWLDNYHGMLDNRVTLGHKKLELLLETVLGSSRSSQSYNSSPSLNLSILSSRSYHQKYRAT
jgi:hypothetical protein